MAALILAAVMAASTGCGGGGGTAVPGPQPTTPAKPQSTAVIPPTPYTGAFQSIADASSQAPAAAARLAAGIVAAGGVRGQVASAASELRAKLTYRLTLHVHLAGLAAVSVLDTGPDSERTKAAFAAVDRNSKALAKLVPAGGRVGQSPAPAATPEANSDPEAEPDTNAARRSPDFLVAWRTHVDDIAAYALAAREEIEPEKDDARRDLQTWADAASSSLKKTASGQVQSKLLRNNLNGYLKAITSAINGLASDDGTGPEQLRKANSAMVGFAENLGAGLARAADLDGDARDGAADVRADLTRLLTENVAMTGATVLASYTHRKTGAANSRQAQIARLGLDDNSRALADRLRPAADPRTEAEFLQLWRAVVYNFLDYSEAVRTGSTKKADGEVATLDTQRATVAAFLAKVVDKKVTAAALSADLKVLVANLTGAVQAVAAEVLPEPS
ncbi:MAG: hypothetical protein ACT4QG_09225 [Sporichthyaceae bacterium]